MKTLNTKYASESFKVRMEHLRVSSIMTAPGTYNPGRRRGDYIQLVRKETHNPYLYKIIFAKLSSCNVG